MKAVSIRQPWASLIMIGAKTIETRSWRTRYRGRIAIHAAQTFGPAERHAALTAVALPNLRHAGLDETNLPRSAVLGIVTLYDCVPVEELGYLIAGTPSGTRERMLGNYAPGRWGWLMSSPEPLPTPAPASGKLSLWEWQR